MMEEEVISHALGIVMFKQFCRKAGLKWFGKKGEEAVSSELTQMHDMEIYVPVDFGTMTPQQKSETLNLLIFLITKQ